MTSFGEEVVTISVKSLSSASVTQKVISLAGFNPDRGFPVRVQTFHFTTAALYTTIPADYPRLMSLFTIAFFLGLTVGYGGIPNRIPITICGTETNVIPATGAKIHDS